MLLLKEVLSQLTILEFRRCRSWLGRPACFSFQLLTISSILRCKPKQRHALWGLGLQVPRLLQQTLNLFMIFFTKLGLSLFRLTFQTKIKSSSRSIMNLFHHGAYQQSTRRIFFNLETILRTFPIQFCASRQARISGTQSQASRQD